MKTLLPLTESSKNVGIWIRVSTEDQAQGDSPEHHLERARSYVKSKGWNVREVYDLSGQTGKGVVGNPNAKRMMKDIERGHITGLVFSKLARLSRNRRELEDFSDFFNKHKADLISLSEAIDTSTAGGRMFFHLLGVFAQWEREEIVERVNASVLIRAKLGKPINGSTPYGYQWKDRKLILHPEQAPIRRKMFELFVQHRRKGVVAKLLNVAGYRTRTGVPWRDMQIHRALVDTSAKGIYYFNRFRCLGAWKYEAKPEDQWGKVPCEPIVSETLWQQANQIIEEQLKSTKRRGKLPVQLFGSLAHCACGDKMYVQAGASKYICRKCHNKIPILDLEDIFHQELKVFFAQPERIEEHLKNAVKNLSEKETLLATHEREVQKVRDEMTRTHRLYLDDQITPQGFGEFYKPAEERLNQLNSELPKLQAEVDFLKVNTLSAEDILHEANTLHARWPSLPLGDKRKIAESLVEKIVIGDNEIDITFSYLPSSEEACKNQQSLKPRC
ncbi:MAG: recombinase family protein [Verrucomicrobiota bacterium]